MEKLADLMGVSKGTLYNYFRDKDDVVFFIMQNQSRQICEALERCAAEQAGTLEILRKMMITTLVMFRDFRFLRAAIGEVVQKQGHTTEEPGRLLSGCIESLSAVIARGVDEGVLRPCDPELTAVLLHAMMVGIGLGSDIDERIDIDKQEVRQVVCDALMRGLVREEK